MHCRTALVRAVLAAAITALLAALLTLAAPSAAGAEEEPDERSTIELPENDGASPASPGAATPAAIESANSDDTYRQALADLSAASGPHTLNITGSFTLEDDGTPVYSGDEDLTINGNGFTINGGGFSAILVFEPTNDSFLTVNDLTFTNGEAGSDGGALDLEEGSGGEINNSTFVDNTSDDDGGAIDIDPNGTTLTVNGGTFEDNSAESEAGAVWLNNDGGLGVFNGVTFTGNETENGVGGAIADEGDTADADVTDSTFTDNNADSSGGAIFIGGDLTVSGSTFANNTAASDGGAIDFSSDLTATGSTFTGNTALFGDGGAIDQSDDEHSTEVTDSLFEGNTAESQEEEYAAGGGISLQPDGTFTVDGTTFAGNTAEEGGGFDIHGDGEIVNSTFTGNTAIAEGGALYTGNEETPDSFSLTYVTIADNSAPEGASVYLDEDVDSMTTFGTNITGPASGGTNCELNGGAVTSQGYNYSDDDTCELTAGTDTENGGDPQLEALGDFGGPTPTRPPLVTSPLVDAIPEADCGSIAVDQRDVTRPQDGNADGTLACDIGAVEIIVESPGEGPIAAAPPFTG